MNMKKTVLLGVALLFGTACAYAVTADEVAAAAEQAALRARMNQVQEEYKGFNLCQPDKSRRGRRNQNVF